MLGEYKCNNLYSEIKLIFITALLGTILENIVTKPTRIAIFYLLLSLSMYLVYSKNKLHFFKIYLITFAIFALSDAFVADVVYRHVDSFNELNNISMLLIQISVSAIGIFIGIILKRVDIFKLKKNIYIEENKTFWLYIGFVVILFTTIIYYFENINSSINNYVVFFMLLFLCCMLVSYVVFSILNKLYIEKNEKKHIELYANMIEESLENIRAFRHDYRNILMCISGYISSNNMEGLKKYFYENLVNDKYINNNVYGLINIKNTHVKGLINIKSAKASSLGLDLNLNIENEIENFLLKDIDICKILGILIDNAIEASTESSRKVINIDILNNKERISIIVSNSFKTKPEINKIFEKGYSTKGNDRGLGLDIVRKLNKKYHNMNMNTYIKDDLFHQEMIIKK
jgi:two-component system sensor histidine kinase AgrC